MKRLLVIVLLLITVLTQAQVRIGEQEAYTTAERFLSQQKKSYLPKISEEIKSQTSGQTNLFVFSLEPQGFVIVSAIGEVLAYSLESSLPHSEELPEHIAYWLDLYNNQTDYLLEHPDQARKPKKSQESVGPLLTSAWGQGCYYNEYCPADNAGPCQHVTAGCVAIAMAQIMYYYKYPKQGTGEASVVVKYDQANVTLNVNLGETTYDWDNMLDDYSGEYTDQQGEAVATLCYHAAVAAKANWNRLGGATFDDDILKAMIENFGYNDTARVLPRPLYNEPQWMEMIYGMLTQRQPILYSGKDINFEVGILVGHNFIIDGYDENGLVHVNWGWHGQQDGYYDIATLTVGKLSFDDWQGMYVGLVPKTTSMTGDVNADGQVDISDVNAVIDIMLGKAQPSMASDVTSDGQVDISDVNAIIDIMLGK